MRMFMRKPWGTEIICRVGTVLCPRGWLISQVVICVPGFSTTAWAQNRAHPTKERILPKFIDIKQQPHAHYYAARQTAH